MISAWSTLSTVLSLFFFFLFLLFFFFSTPFRFSFHWNSNIVVNWLRLAFTRFSLSPSLFFFFFLFSFSFFFFVVVSLSFNTLFWFLGYPFVIFVLQCDAPPFLLQTSNAHICASSLAAGVYSLSLFFFFLLSCSLTRGKRKVVRGDKSSTRWYDSPAGFVIQWGRKTYLFLYTNSCQALLSLFFSSPFYDATAFF